VPEHDKIYPAVFYRVPGDPVPGIILARIVVSPSSTSALPGDQARPAI